jgi:hypothetical protein
MEGSSHPILLSFQLCRRAPPHVVVLHPPPGQGVIARIVVLLQGCFVRVSSGVWRWTVLDLARMGPRIFHPPLGGRVAGLMPGFMSSLLI